MQFRLVEKKTFLEYVPSKGEWLRRSSSFPLLLSTEANEGPAALDASIPKPHRIESDEVSPGAASVLETCTWRLASTRGCSVASLSTSAMGDSTHGGSSWFLEEVSADDGLPHPAGHDNMGRSPAPTSPASSISPPSLGRSASTSSWTTMGNLQPSESAGSAQHEAGLCRPCAWYWRPGSCSRGAGCLHCHLCPDGELGKRRFENRKLAKLRKKQARDRGLVRRAQPVKPCEALWC